LIQDQLRSLPPRVPAATLSGSISVSATAAIIDDVVRKRIKILFVSPERLTSPSFRRLFNTTWNPDTQEHERRFPEISLLCVDEAHCVSQWAHNFRPCFLRFKRLLQLMEPRSVLAVTATAGSRVIGDITSVLGIDTTSRLDDDASGGEENNVLIIDKPRYNIDVSCQFVESHEERLEMVR
jgi:superfamily II DNA helicase RecQ